LERGDDITLSDWRATIFGPPGGNHEGRIYSLHIHCGPNYPAEAPHVRFLSKINLPFVNQHNGQLNPGQFHILSNWNPDRTIEHILVELRKEMNSASNKRLPQPGEGDTY
jgi:ubiquitin-conjugating enzyme E2 variant